MVILQGTPDYYGICNPLHHHNTINKEEEAHDRLWQRSLIDARVGEISR